MAVADETSPAIRKPLLLHRSQKYLGFRLDRFCEQPAGPIAQHRGKGILDRVGMSKCGNDGIRRHRRIAPLEVRAGFNNRPDTQPFSNRHHSVSAIAHTDDRETDLR